MPEVTMKQIWETLSKIDISSKIEKKVGFSYLSWANAWVILMQNYPDSTFKIIKNSEGRPYFIDEHGAFVETSVTICGYSIPMQLFVMDDKMKPMKPDTYSYKVKKKEGGTYEKFVNAIDSSKINKSIMRCLAKNIAMFGLGISLWQGEDLPSEEGEDVAWDELRKTLKIGGNGQHKDELWADTDIGYLTWCVNPPADKVKFTKRLKPLAEKELEYRRDTFTDLAAGKKPEEKSDDLAELRANANEVVQEVIVTLLQSDMNQKHFESEISKAKSKARLGILVMQLKAIEIDFDSLKEKSITGKEYSTFFGRIVVAETSKEINQITKELLATKGNGKTQTKVLDAVRHSIQKYFEENNISPSEAMNSMTKHLGGDDQYACNDINKLDEYYAYLSNKPAPTEKPKPTVMKGQVSGKDLEKEDGVVFTDDEKPEEEKKEKATTTQDEFELG